MSLDVVSASIAFTGTIPTDNNSPGTKKRMVASKLKSRTRVLFSDVPTVGNVFTQFYQPRDALVSNSGNTPFTDNNYQFDGKYSTASSPILTVPEGVSYRLLLR